MKTRILPRHESAVALIIVLAMLVLLSGLIVSFMTAVGNERAASVVSNNQLTSRQIADSTVNLVISQLRQATSQSGNTANPTTWASQPGAIRTFSGKVSGSKSVTNGAGGVRQATYSSGANDFVFKLYSAENMKVSPSTFGTLPWDKSEVDNIQNWEWKLSEKDREETQGMYGYVDLNEPIVTPMPESLTKGDRTIVEPRYPIVDPRAKYDENENANTTAEPGIVEGFDIKTTGLTNNKLKFLPKGQTGVRNNESAKNVPYLPMPVKWLYVMRDGSMAAAEDKNKGRIPGATKDNPIIGRTAFWTDDDSTRLNINTASEGTFWDTPTGSSRQDSGDVDGNLTIAVSPLDPTLSFAASQPARGEYQRYPGHPATTCLSPALGWMWDVLPKHFPRQYKDPKLIGMKDAIAQLSPFLAYGKVGSLTPSTPPNSTTMGGSYNPAKETLASNPDLPPKAEKDPKLAIGTKHLYSTGDELVFKQERVPVPPAKANDPTSLNGALIPESLEKVRFFLTANSRSPELNLFGRPRVTFWPVNADPTQRTGFDDLFAFTSTFYKNLDDPTGQSDNAFFFTRSNAKSASVDYNPKNQEMLNYLKVLTSSTFPIPGFGGSFADKYGVEETDEILTLIFDYCRCVNLVDTSTRVRTGAPFRPYTPFYGNSSAYNAYSPRSADWSGEVTPIQTFPGSKHQGFGRFPTVSEAAVVFHRTGAKGEKLQATLLFEMATVMAGFPAIRDTYYMTVQSGDRPTTVGGTDIELVGPTERYNIVNVGSHDVGYGRSYLPILGFMNQLHYFIEPDAATKDKDIPALSGQAQGKTFSQDPSTLLGSYVRKTTSKFYPYVSKIFDIPTGPDMKFNIGSFIVRMYAAEAPDDKEPGRGQLVQTYNISFPNLDVTVKTPTGRGAADASFNARLDGREQETKLTGWDLFGNGIGDVIRSVEFVGAKSTGAGGFTTLAGDSAGDLRLGAAMRIVPKEAFAPRGGVDKYKSTDPRVHGLQAGHADPYTGYFDATGRGVMAAAGTNRGNKPPILPAGIKGVKRDDGGPGDWDRGLAKHMDGAMANKVDEGNVQFDDRRSDGGKLPYFLGRSIQETGKSFFSPNRQMSSAVMFGSIPTGAVRGLPWQTLLFRPDRGAKSHPGAQQVGKPADHLILDLFNLPVVEPYAISEPFSTGGKVNLNYIIAPFGYAKGESGKPRKGSNMDRSYLKRDTALRGVLKSVKMMAVPTGEPEAAHAENPLAVATNFRFDIDAERTLDQFENRFKDPDRGLFRSASEICDMDLYPFSKAASSGVVAPASKIPPIGPASTNPPEPIKPLTDWGTFWDTDYAQTGDNMRERPYAHIYPRVTTKSNVFTIYMRCQAVKKTAGTPEDVFDPVKDKVIGAYRGSATVERFIDPNDPELRGYVPTASNASVDQLYRFRVLATKQFLPR